MPAWYMEVRVGLLFLQSFLGVLVFGYSLPRRNSMVKTALYLLAGGGGLSSVWTAGLLPRG